MLAGRTPGVKLDDVGLQQAAETAYRTLNDELPDREAGHFSSNGAEARVELPPAGDA